MEKSGYLWLLLYFFCNLILTIYNKAVMQFIGFKYPWTLTGIHTFCSAIGSLVAVYGFNVITPAPLGRFELAVMVAFSFLYTINIAVSNISLNLVSVPFHQVVRATTPVFTIILSIAFLGKSFPTMTYVSLIPVILGVGLATFGDYDFTAWGIFQLENNHGLIKGFFLTLLGTFLAAVKTVVTNVVQVGSLKLHPLHLLLLMSPLATIQCWLFASLSGEWEKVQEFVKESMNERVFYSLLLNGILAFCLNIVSFTANKKTSALTMTVAANIKQVLSIILAIMIFNLSISGVNAFGIFLTLAGGAWYTYVEMMEKESKKTLPMSKT